jgi:diguanylate cyclase (GGDEF)-like protein/PAS domain S-box-containing protein
MPASRRDENRLPSAVLVLFVLAAVTTFAVSVCSMLNVKLLSDSHASVARTNAVLQNLSQLRADLLSAQQARVGYRLGQEQQHDARAAFQRAQIAVQDDMQALASLTADNPGQEQRITDLAPLIDARLKYLRDSISEPQPKAGAPRSAPDTELSQVNFAAVSQSNAVMDEFQLVESRLLEDRDARYHHSFAMTSVLVGGGSIFGPAMLLGLFWLLKRENDRYRSTSESLRESRENLQMIVDQARDYAILQLDPQGRVTTWNKGAERMTGYSDAEALGKSFHLFYPPDDLAEGNAVHTLELARVQGQYHEEGWRVRKDGSRFWADDTVTALRESNGALRGYSKLTRDATQRRAAELELQQREGHFKRLSKLGEFLHSCRTVDEAYRVTQPVLGELFPCASGQILVLSKSDAVLEPLGRWGARVFTDDFFTPEKCWGLRLNRIHHAGASAGLICPHFHKQELGLSSLCIPLNAQGDMIGLLLLTAPDADGESVWTETRQAMAEAIAQQFALALANLQLRETLLRQSIRDPLTGLHNRRFLEESFEREMHRATRRKRPLAVLMVDIDHFKKFNDEFGHAAGDTILREVGMVLRAGTRKEDIACRYGGEEFALILTDATREGAVIRAKQIRDGVHRLAVQEGGQVLGPLTVSVGVATYPENGSTPAELLARADEALYDAKERGRDRVSTAEIPPSVVGVS